MFKTNAIFFSFGAFISKKRQQLKFYKFVFLITFISTLCKINFKEIKEGKVLSLVHFTWNDQSAKKSDDKCWIFYEFVEIINNHLIEDKSIFEWIIKYFEVLFYKVVIVSFVFIKIVNFLSFIKMVAAISQHRRWFCHVGAPLSSIHLAQK